MEQKFKNVNTTMCKLHTGVINTPDAGSRAFFPALKGRKPTRNRYATCTYRCVSFWNPGG